MFRRQLQVSKETSNWTLAVTSNTPRGSRPSLCGESVVLAPSTFVEATTTATATQATSCLPANRDPFTAAPQQHPPCPEISERLRMKRNPVIPMKTAPLWVDWKMTSKMNFIDVWPLPVGNRPWWVGAAFGEPMFLPCQPNQ